VWVDNGLTFKVTIFPKPKSKESEFLVGSEDNSLTAIQIKPQGYWARGTTQKPRERGFKERGSE